MKKISIFSAIIGLLIYGCSSNEEVYNNYHKEGDKSFRVTVEQPVFNETRAHLDNQNNKLIVVFDGGDEISVFDKNTANSVYTYSSTEPEFSGTSLATGNALEGIYALYPYSPTNTYNSGNLPYEQTYCENSFSNESQIMYGQTDDIAKGFNLKNMCGYIRLHLYGENVLVKEIALSVTGEGEYVSGDFQIGASDGSDDYALTMKNEGENQKQSVKLVCPEGGVGLGTTSENTRVFYIALPPQKYKKGFSVTITDVHGRDVTYTAFTNGGFTLERNHIKPMEALKIDKDLQEVLPIEEIEGKQYAQIDTPERLLKWGYTVNNFNNTLGFVLKGNITMPLKEIEEDPANKTYKITERIITVNDGVPSGSNWMPVGTFISSSDLTKAFKGNIVGNGKYINGLCINGDAKGVGLVGCFCDGSIKDLTISNSYIYNKKDHVGIVGYNRYNTVIENVHLKGSYIQGAGYVGGIVGNHYRRLQNASQTHEILPYIIYCSTDENCIVKGTGSNIGGICGYSYGAAVINCENNADVTGVSHVGGVVGTHREYNKTRVNSYIINCKSSEKATIKATNGSAGGLLGYSESDSKNHPNAISYVVGCYSLSEVEGNTKGSLVGLTHTINCHIIGSWAKQYGTEKVIGGTANHTNINTFSSTESISEDEVNEMNSAIDNYNSDVKDDQTDAIQKVKCHYKWQYNAGGWPTLIPITPSDGN